MNINNWLPPTGFQSLWMLFLMNLINAAPCTQLRNAAIISRKNFYARKQDSTVNNNNYTYSFFSDSVVQQNSYAMCDIARQLWRRHASASGGDMAGSGWALLRCRYWYLREIFVLKRVNHLMMCG